MSTNKNMERGFTLIEALVAISILAVSVGGPLYSASRALVAAQIARDKLTASYLAQEGIEHVRMVRDNKYLEFYAGNTDDAWSDFVSNIAQCGEPGSLSACILDPTRPATPSVGNGSGFQLNTCTIGSVGNDCGPLYLNSAKHYVQKEANNERTKFTRIIQASATSPTEEKIVSTVSWTSHNQDYNVTITDHLTSWQ